MQSIESMSETECSSTASTPLCLIGTEHTPVSLMNDDWVECEYLMKSFASEGVLSATQNFDTYEIDHLTCDHCSNIGMDVLDGFVYCIQCGMTKDSVLDSAAEWRTFGIGKQDNSRCGMPINPLLPHSGFSTVLVGGGNTYLKKIHKWGSMNHKDIAKFKIFMFIHSRASRFGLPPAVINQAQTYGVQLCDKMIEQNNVCRGKHRQGLIAACLYFAFKKLSCPRSITEIANILELDPGCVTCGINSFSEFFMHASIILHDKTISAAELTPRYCSQLGMPYQMIQLVSMTADQMLRANILHNNVVEAQAAACIWYVIKVSSKQELFSKKSVSAVCAISEMTISKCTKKLEEHLDRE